MGSGRGGLHKGTWGSREGEDLRVRVNAAFKQFGGSVVGDAAAELADALVRIASGEAPEDVIPEPGEMAFDLALDVLTPFVPGGGRVTRELGEAAGNAGRVFRAESAGRSVGSNMRSVRLPRDEYAKVMSALNDMYHSRLAGKSKEYISIGEYTYEVAIHEFDEYTITDKWRLE